MEGFAFFTFGDREYLIDVTAGADGDDLIGIVSRLFADVFFHGVPLGDSDLVFEKADGTDIKGRGKQQFIACEKGKLGASAADVDIKIGVFLVEIFRYMVL